MMKKLLALLVMAVVASPLFAASTITISAVDAGSGILRVSYTVDAASDSDPVGMALNFASSAATTVAADVTNVDPLFPVYLDYAHDAGSGYNFNPVTGSPLAKTDAAGVPAAATQTFAICVGRLGQAAPTKGAAHVLCDIKLTAVASAAYTDVTISADSLRGGVVGSVFTVNAPATPVRVTFAVPKCMKETAPEFATWQTWGEPACWCYKRQCRGDVNNAKEFNKWVMGADLALFKLAYNKTNAQLLLITNGICADFNHGAEFSKRVMGGDLAVFKLYYNKADASVPECDMTNYNFWN